MKAKRKIIMKKSLLIVLSLFSVYGLWGQVGINTENPQGVLHIDSKGDTNGSTNTSDDVIVNSDGNLGVGLLSPAAKVEPLNNGTTPLMRIVDGTQGVGKILRSDDDGNASWVNMPTTDGRVYNVNASAQSFTIGATTLLQSIPITESGNFLVTIRWWGTSTTVSSDNQTSAIFFVTQSNNATDNWAADAANEKDRTEYYVVAKASSFFSFSTSLYANVQAGSNLKVYIRVSSAGPWNTGVVGSTPTYNPSIVIYRV